MAGAAGRCAACWLSCRAYRSSSARQIPSLRAFKTARSPGCVSGASMPIMRRGRFGPPRRGSPCLRRASERRQPASRRRFSRTPGRPEGSAVAQQRGPPGRTPRTPLPHTGPVRRASTVHSELPISWAIISLPRNDAGAVPDPTSLQGISQKLRSRAPHVAPTGSTRTSRVNWRLAVCGFAGSLGMSATRCHGSSSCCAVSRIPSIPWAIWLSAKDRENSSVML